MVFADVSILSGNVNESYNENCGSSDELIIPPASGSAFKGQHKSFTSKNLQSKYVGVVQRVERKSGLNIFVDG